MPLFTDGLLASTSDLTAIESTALATATSEGLDLHQKLISAQSQLGREISVFLIQQGYVSAGQDLSCVFVNDTLRTAHAFHALALTYRDLASRRVQDRFEDKAKYYERLAANTTSQAFEVGIGICSAPLRAPSGVILKVLSGGTRPARRLHVRAAAIGSGVVTSAWTSPEVIDLEAGQLAEVSLPVESETQKWVVYGSYSEFGYQLQTLSPLTQQAKWNEPATGLLSNTAELPVQAPEIYVHMSRRLLRG